MNVRRDEGGFTLIELILVLFIIVAGMAIIGPNISSGQASTQIRATARDIGSALRYVRGLSLANQKQAVFSLDLDNSRYRVENRDKAYPIPDDIEITLVTAQSELEGEGQGNIRFFPDGSSTGGRITLERDGFKHVIDINWLTGSVESIEE